MNKNSKATAAQRKLLKELATTIGSHDWPEAVNRSNKFILVTSDCPTSKASCSSLIEKCLAWVKEHPAPDHSEPELEPEVHIERKPFTVGEVVEHPKFGAGTIIAADDRALQISFNGVARLVAHSVSGSLTRTNDLPGLEA